jgi:hypothetical protein
MVTSSPLEAREQFQTFSRRPSNLDKCLRCGSQRSAHGPDWSCPSRPAISGSIAWLILGTVLTTVGLIARLNAGLNQSMTTVQIASAAIVVGLILVVSGTVLLRWPR